jgi:4-carboxymuconolactone decarboxylase
MGGKVLMLANAERLRRLALHDERCIESVLGMKVGNPEGSGLDRKTHALVCLGALVVMGGGPVSFHTNVGSALSAGATNDEIVGTLVAVAPISGLARVISAIPGVALAIGYDIEQAFETFNGNERG